MKKITSTANEDTNKRAVTQARKEEQCSLYMWDNYLVQSFRYEMGVYNQLQGTRILLNKGSKGSSCSELEAEKHSLACQIYHEMRQNTDCEYCTRPRVLCTCVRLDSPLGAFGNYIQEEACYFCEHLLRDCDYDDLLELSRTLMEDDNTALFYLLQEERGTQSSNRNRRLRGTESPFKLPVKYNPVTSEKAVRVCKNHKSPFGKSGDLKLSCYGRGNTKRESGKCKHCQFCAKPLNRCVCEKVETSRQRKEKHDNSGKMSFQNQGGKFVYFPKKNQSVTTRGTRGRVDQDKDRFTQIVEKFCRSKKVTHPDRREVSRKSDCYDLRRTVEEEDEQTPCKLHDVESTFVETDVGHLCEEKATEMEHFSFVEEVPDNREEPGFSRDTEQKMETLDVAVPKAPQRSSSIHNEIVKATEQVTREEFTIKKALDDLNITVTITKQTEETTPMFESARYDETESCETSKAIENVHRSREFNPLLPRFMIEENSVVTNSVAEIEDEYSCSRIESKRYVMGKVFMQSMEEKKRVVEAPEFEEGTNKVEYNISSGENCHQIVNEHYRLITREIETDSPKQTNKDTTTEQKLQKNTDGVCVSTNSPSKKFVTDTTETTTEQCVRKNTNEKCSKEIQIKEDNKTMKIDHCTSDLNADFQISTKETQYETTLTYTKSKYSTINTNNIETTDVSTEFFLSQELINRHLRLPGCIAENSIKFPTSNATTRYFFDKTFNTSSAGKDTEVISTQQNDAKRSLSTKSETCVEINQSIKSRITISKEGNESEVIETFSVKDLKKFLDNRKKRSKGNVQLSENEFKQTQTGGTFEQDVIASILKGFNSDLNNVKERAFRNLLQQFRGYDLDKNISPRSIIDLSKSSRNSIVGLCLSPFDHIRSIQIQVGSNSLPVCVDTQTNATCDLSESQDLSQVSAPSVSRLFRKKFNYVCGPEGPEFKTKILMNLNKLLQVTDSSIASGVVAETETSDNGAITDQSEEWDDVGEESDRNESGRRRMVNDSTDLPEFRETSTRAWRRPCVPFEDSEEDLQNVRRCEFWRSDEEEIDYQELSHRPNYEKQNSTFAAYYSSHSTFVPKSLIEPFQDGIEPILKPRKIVTSEHDMIEYVSQTTEANKKVETCDNSQNISDETPIKVDETMNKE